MKLLITGGTVFASRYTAEYFANKNHEVYVLNRNSRPQSAGVHLINCDRHSLGDILKPYVFDAVIDVTAYTENDISTLLDGLGKFGEYIMISSSAVYPETNTQPFSENQQCGYNSHWGTYGTDKLAAERFLHKNVPSAYIIRPPYLYGKMNNLYREAFVFECAENGRPFYVPKNSELTLQFFDIEDMCRFIEIILDKKPANRIFNTGNPQSVTVKEWVKLCYSITGRDAEIITAPESMALYDYFPFRDYSYFLDVTKQTELMPDVKSLENGLMESYQWYKNNKELIRRKCYIDNLNTEVNKNGII